ncbi:MAG: DUF1016 family protein [Bacilli bacterium]|nr:DUF1016 family protein [Bacilli bacterium]
MNKTSKLKDNYYSEIKERLLEDIAYSAIKDMSKERHRLETYYDVGKMLAEAGKHYGNNIIGKYAEKLITEVGRKYDKSTLYKIRKFYLVFSNEKVAPLAPHLTWSHCLLLLPLKDINKINYYIKQISIKNISKRQLHERIKLKEYERLDDETKLKLINKEDTTITDLVPNPIVIKSSNIKDKEHIKEYVLKETILDDLDNFLSQLGSGYTYVSNEYKIKIGNTFNYIDLLLFNIEYNCYVVIELKVTELKKEHLGQIQVYMNYIDTNVKKINHDKTIGIILVRKDNKYIVKYSSDERIISREYELV